MLYGCSKCFIFPANINSSFPRFSFSQLHEADADFTQTQIIWVMKSCLKESTCIKENANRTEVLQKPKVTAVTMGVQFFMVTFEFSLPQMKQHFLNDRIMLCGELQNIFK